jgi:hypothetical protein
MYVVIGAAGVLLLILVVWAGHRMLRNPTGNGGGVADGMGVFVDVFDPARARADRDLKSKDNETQVVPSPGGDGHPIQIDQASMQVRIRRSAAQKPPTDRAVP